MAISISWLRASLPEPQYLRQLSSPEHGANGRSVEPSQFQRQRDQFVVAGRNVGQYEIFDNPKVVPPADHVRRQAFRGLRKSHSTGTPSISRSGALTNISTVVPEPRRSFRSQGPIRPPHKTRYRAGGDTQLPLPSIVIFGRIRASNNFFAAPSRSIPSAAWRWLSMPATAARWQR
jgi:hypothetical protein